jgi:hypothetical protein
MVVPRGAASVLLTRPLTAVSSLAVAMLLVTGVERRFARELTSYAQFWPWQASAGRG